MPLLFWAGTAVTGLFFGAQALSEADQAAKSTTRLIIIGGIVYFLVMNPRIVKKFLGRA